jgi:hypothetical protein
MRMPIKKASVVYSSLQISIESEYAQIIAHSFLTDLNQIAMFKTKDRMQIHYNNGLAGHPKNRK